MIPTDEKHDYVLIREDKLMVLIYVIAGLLAALIASCLYIHSLTTDNTARDSFHGGGGGKFAVVTMIKEAS